MEQTKGGMLVRHGGSGLYCLHSEGQGGRTVAGAWSQPELHRERGPGQPGEE